MQVAFINSALIGAPINKSFKVAVTTHPNIGSTTIIDLKDKGDPIYGGISDEELMKTSVELGQMSNGSGHFYYLGDSTEGKSRRRELAKLLYVKGLR